MGSVGPVERYREWKGTAAELARVAEEACRDAGVQLGGPLTERLVPDYAARGIVTRPGRDGVGFPQLLQLLAARNLLEEGWPLGKIAENLADADEPALLALLPGEFSNRAVAVVRRL